MRIIYRITVDHLDDAELKVAAETFAERYSSYRDGVTWFFDIDDSEDARGARAYLAASKLEWGLAHHLRITKDEIDQFPACFPGLPAFYNVINPDESIVDKHLRNRSLVKDLGTGKIVATTRLVELLQDRSGLGFQPFPGDRGSVYFALEIENTLKEPVGVAKATQINRISETGETYFVVSDGRYFLSEMAAKEIEGLGVARYDKVVHDGSIYDIAPQVILSGNVARLLIDKGALEVADVVVILPGGHELLSDSLAAE